jgi:hypothetical protein
MEESLGVAVVDAVRDVVPFLAIVVVWIVVALALYGLFFVTKPSGIAYDAWVYGAVFAVPGLGFAAHLLKQALKA